VTALETFYETINIKVMIKGKAGISLTERTECTEKNNKISVISADSACPVASGNGTGVRGKCEYLRC